MLMRRRTVLAGWLLTAAAIAALTLLGGCTYANVPAQRGDHLMQHDPNRAAVRRVTIAAARAALAQWPVEGPVRVVLPRGTAPIAYDQTLPPISPEAVGPDSPVETAATLHIEAVRIRGRRAEVDLIRPLVAGEPEMRQLLTARLTNEPLTGWHVDELRAWRTDVDAALLRHPGPPAAPQLLR